MFFFFILTCYGRRLPVRLELLDLPLLDRLPEFLLETPLDRVLELELFEFESEFKEFELERVELLFRVDVFAPEFVFVLFLLTGVYVDSQVQIDLVFLVDGLLLDVLAELFSVITSSVLLVLSRPPE
jgi:hypothetical protein